MFSIKRIRTGAASLVALMALAFGGSAIANATQSTPGSSPPAVTSTVDTPTPGDTADTTTASATDVATPGDKADNATDVPTAGDKADSTDVATAGDKADTGTESGNEIPGADGPNGHADESPAQR